MTHRISATEASRQFSDLLNRVRYAGDSFVIVRGGEEVGTLARTGALKRGKATIDELFATLQHLPPSDPSFADDLEEIQASQTPIGEGPWES